MVAMDEFLDLFGTQFRRFVYDNFMSTETISEAVTQTAEITKYLTEIELSTGIQEGSTAKIYYNFPAFNPHYSYMFFKLQFTDIENILAFAGFKKSTADPTFDMIESHAGFLINTVNNKGQVYTSTGDDYNQQTINLEGIMSTNNLVYKIVKDKFAYYPLPVMEPYFDGIASVNTSREWSNDTQNGNITPLNQDHYFMLFIKNTAGAEKIVRIKFFLYGERYAD